MSWAEKKAKRKKNQKKYTLTDEIYHKLNDMLQRGKGRSKHRDKALGANKKYIYSTATFENYKKLSKKYASWLKKTHPEVLHLKDAKEHINEYLEWLISENRSSWTISTIKSALSKTFGVDYSEMIKTPPRERQNVYRSRFATERDKHISEETEAFLSRITSATGLRRAELEHVTGDDLVFERGFYFINVTKRTKGGLHRRALVMGENEEDTKFVVDLFKKAGKLRVIPRLHQAYDNHFYRGVYAKRIYNKFARNVEKLDKKDKYIMRKDRAGEVLDRRAMLITSKMLGHSRIDVIAQSYLYPIFTRYA